MNNCGCNTGHICYMHGGRNDKLSVGGLALQSPTPEQIDHDILEQLSMFRQKIADLQTAKDFHMACIENLVDRLNEAEGKLKSIEEQFLQFIELRKIKKINGNFCGCEAIIDIETQHYKVIRGCQLHQEWAAGLCGQKKIKGTG